MYMFTDKLHLGSLTNHRCSKDQILSDTLTLQDTQLKDGDVLMAKVRAPQILGCRQCPAFFLVRGDGRVAVWGDASLGMPKRLKNPQQVVACGSALAALVDGEVITWGHARYRPPEHVHLKEICQLCVTWQDMCWYRLPSFGRGSKRERFEAKYIENGCCSLQSLSINKCCPWFLRYK